MLDARLPVVREPLAIDTRMHTAKLQIESVRLLRSVVWFKTNVKQIVINQIQTYKNVSSYMKFLLVLFTCCVKMVVSVNLSLEED